MKKSTIIHVVVMVVAVIAASLLASKLTADQKALLPEKATMSKMPVGGFHKFMADVEWMLFINYMGSQSTVDETNIDEVTRRLERLIALDPNLDKLYQDGVSSISVADPEKTVELLKRACENHHLRNNAEILQDTNFPQDDFHPPREILCLRFFAEFFGVQELLISFFSSIMKNRTARCFTM